MTTLVSDNATFRSENVLRLSGQILLLHAQYLKIFYKAFQPGLSNNNEQVGRNPTPPAHSYSLSIERPHKAAALSLFGPVFVP